MRDRLLAALGWLYIAVGLALNPWILGRFLSPDGSIGSPRLIALIVLVEVLFITLGAVTLRKRRSELVLNLNLLIVSVGIGGPLVGELMFRVGIALKIPSFRSPDLYADWYSDDDYWKLQQRWEPLWKPGPESIHTLLGWTQTVVTPDNPLGLSTSTLARLASSGPKLLFYGDSFVGGTPSDRSFRLPEYLNDRLDGIEVVDLGVGGYGLDQIYLLFRETLDAIEHQTILIGILPNDDLDRTVLSFRSSQKPTFIVDSAGKLELRGVPIERDQEKYAREFPISIHSYLFAFLTQTLVGANQKDEQKKAISSKLLDRFVADARQADAALIFVLFHGEGDLLQTSWQEEFLKAELVARQLPFIDTKGLLLTHIQRSGLQSSSLYKQGDGHHNDLGNQVIGNGILDYLRTWKGR